MVASPAASCPLDGQLHDADVIVEGLGFLSLLSNALGGHVVRVPLRPGAALPALSQLWVASLRSNEEDGSQVLAPQIPLASVKGVVSGSVLDTIDVCHDDEVLLEPCDGLFFVVVVALGDEEG
jgi:hypothetical protein